MGTLKIERIGGLAGFGLPNSRIRSNGELAISALSATDQTAVESLFESRASRPDPGQARDAFRYRITRTKNGQDQTVEVPESAVPQMLKNCLTDKLM